MANSGIQLRNLDHERALNALGIIKVNFSKEFKTDVLKLIPLIYNSGIIAALAYAQAKKNRAFLPLSKWFEMNSRFQYSGPDLVIYLINSDSTEVIQYAKEALAYLAWLKRLSEAESSIKDDENQKEI